MTDRRFQVAAVSVLVLGLLPGSVGAQAAAPPGLNVHLVHTQEGNRLWRGAAPRRDTVEALAGAARAKGRRATFIDLRHPANADDRSGKSNRLSPADEQALCRKSGVDYLAISALDRNLIPRLQEALGRGDVYMHCMYGVNRTGFAAGRYSRSLNLQASRKGAGSRDWRQGEEFETRIQAAEKGKSRAK